MQLNKNRKSASAADYALHISLGAHAIFELLLKWMGAVLFQKVFERISEEIAGADTSLFDNSSPFWKVLFLSDLSFEIVLMLMCASLVIEALSGGYFVSIARWRAEISEAKRRIKVIEAAITGSQISSGGEAKSSDQVAQVLKHVTLLYEYEVFVKYEREKHTVAALFGILLGFLFLPQVAAIMLGIFILVEIFNAVFYRYTLSKTDRQVADIKEKLQLRCLDIARCADVISTCNMHGVEVKNIEVENKKAISLQRTRAKRSFLQRSLQLGLLASTLPIALALIYYEFDKLSDEPIDIVFSLFALLTLLDQVHKSVIYLDSTDDVSREYYRIRKELNEWLDSRKIDSNHDSNDPSIDSDENDYGPTYEENTSSSVKIETMVPNISFATGEPSSDWIRGDIRLENISISYSNVTALEKQDLDGLEALARPLDTCIMENKSFTFKYKQSTALIGESGSGKSSLLKVIAGLLIPSHGNIFIGSLQLSAKTRNLFRGDMSMCSQDSLLFARSIRENLWYGNNEPCDDEKIYQVIEKVGLQNWLSSQPKGLDQILSTGEEQVSGGQAQRLQLARLLCKNNHYVLLDEACSALDGPTRERILSHLKVYLQDKTALWITHNPVVTEIVDCVVDLSIQ